YEEAGVLRDVFQNHLLQLLALVAMEPPAQWEARSVRNEKVKVLEAASCTDPRTAVFGQYTAGNGLPAYTDEDGVAPGSEQATFAAACFGIRNWRWNGVPFYVRAGKGLARKATEIVLHYRVPPHVPFSDREGVRADRLVLRLAPDEGIDVVFNVKKPGGAVRFTPARLNFSYAGEFGAPNPDAYETLLLDALRGDATLFMREDEVETQWEIITPLLAAAAAAGAPEPYAAGSEGPAGATDLLERTGRSWHAPGGNA
ncbi:MAG TPA: glucose-6-phosphate dehydrogenase, partial [Deinococcales bacterium]|nr:glucose-6-phosphate dehydrogenase [Deinococcales bacterium]